VLPNVTVTPVPMETDTLTTIIRDQQNLKLAKMDRLNPAKFRANQLASKIRLRLDLKEKKSHFGGDGLVPIPKQR
jgi:hypothetical protein